MINLSCYESLCNEPVKWMWQAHGEGRALGWRGSNDAITRCYNLFANYDMREPKKVLVDETLKKLDPTLKVEPTSDLPSEEYFFVSLPKPRLVWPYGRTNDTAYIFIEEDRLRASLVLYFECMIAREQGQDQPARVSAAPCERQMPDDLTADNALDYWMTPSEVDTLVLSEEDLREDPLDFQDWVYDADSVNQMAQMCADSFIARIEVATFLPNTTDILYSEYSLTRAEQSESHTVEDIATKASA
jgi:hypothetical protein